MNCVSCGKEMSRSGKTERCSCGGAWVPEAALLAMAEQKTGSFLRIPWKPRRGAVRSCPQCGQGMVPVSVESVALDRCESHGIWFDPEELQTVLGRAPQFPEGGVPDERSPLPPPARGPIEWQRVDSTGDHQAIGGGSLNAAIGALLLDPNRR